MTKGILTEKRLFFGSRNKEKKRQTIPKTT